MTVILAWQAAAGATLLVSAFVAGWWPTLIMDDGPVIAGAIGATIIAGAGLAMWGLFHRDVASRSWAIEFAGHALLVGALVAYSWQAAIEHPAAVISWSQPAALAVASALRACQVLRQDRIARGTECAQDGRR